MLLSLTPTQYNTFLVSDFGLSRVIEDVSHAQTLTACGTPSWAAPEVLKEDHFSLSADVYSFAVCLWEMCTREEPYKGRTPNHCNFSFSLCFDLFLYRS